MFPFFQVEPLSRDRDRNLDNHVLEDTDKIKPDSKLKNKGNAIITTKKNYVPYYLSLAFFVASST